MADATSILAQRPNTLGSNILVYGATFILLVLFAYFIYNFLFVNYKVSITATGNLILNEPIRADTLPANSKQGITSILNTNTPIPTITEGNEFSVSFWIYISGYKTNLGRRKHIFEIYGDKFSTLLVALGARSPILLVRVHTAPELESSGNWGLTDCSGNTLDPTGRIPLSEDCSGRKIGFQKITDTNLLNTMKDNTLFPTQVNDFFKPNIVVDENNLIDSTSTCDYKTLDMNKWSNVCLVMNGKTLEIYLDGKLVKSCVYKSYFKVDNSGLKVGYLRNEAGFDGYLSRIQMFNSVLNPDEIYKNYLQGPTGNSVTSDPLSFIKYIFTS